MEAKGRLDSQVNQAIKEFEELLKEAADQGEELDEELEEEISEGLRFDDIAIKQLT